MDKIKSNKQHLFIKSTQVLLCVVFVIGTIFLTRFRLVYAATGSVTDSYTDTSKINTGLSSNYVVSGGQLTILLPYPNGQSCTLGSDCTSGFCADSVCCNTACTGSTCQRCDSASNAGAGTCGYASNSSTDPDNECTASLNACSGNTPIGPDGNCSGTEYSCKTTGNTGSACTTAGTCQTGGGCSAGTCTAVSNVAAYNEGTGCTAVCTGCNGSGSCVVIPNATQDSWGSNTCTTAHYRCNGGGSCTAPTYYFCRNSTYTISCVGECANGGGWCIGRPYDGYNCTGSLRNDCNNAAWSCPCNAYSY